MDDGALRLICREVLWAKQKKTFFATVLALIAAGISFGFKNVSWLPLICLGYIAAIWLDTGLMWYRQKRGFYGNNAMEALELIHHMNSRRRPAP